jgi:integrase
MAHILEKPATDRSPKRYVVRYRVDAAWHGKTFVRKEDAKRFVSTVEADLARGDWLDPKLAKTPFKVVADAWFATNPGEKAKTRTGYAQLLRNHVLPYFGAIPVARITKTTVRTWLAEMIEKGASAGTIRNAYTVLKPILDTAVEQNLIRANPLSTGDRIKLPRPPKDEALFLTAEQVEALASEIDPRYSVLIRFAAYTGLRAGELCALRVKNLDLMRKVVHVTESVTLQAPFVYGPTKTYAERKVNLPAFLVDALAEHVAPRAGNPNAFVFESREGKPLVYGTFYSTTFRPAVRSALPAALAGLRFHDLRHTCAALMVNLAGADAYLVMRRMGHSSITVTYNRYAKLFPERDEEITTGLDAAYRRAVAIRPAPETTADVVALR